MKLTHTPASARGTMGKLYQANHPAVCHETFEGETVLINVDAGTYFSLTKSAPIIWAMLQEPTSLEGILSRLIAVFPTLPPDAQAGVLDMIELLCAEGCLVMLDGAENATAGRESRVPSTAPFELPVVQVFRDLKDLIVVDPVHEVDPFDGWPHRPPSDVPG